MAERKPTGLAGTFQTIHKTAVVLYALFMALVQSHYITAQIYPDSEYFFGVWYDVSDAQLMVGEVLAIFANIGLLLSPFLAAPGRVLRVFMLGSLALGLIIGTVHLAHMFSINAFYPFWPQQPIDAINMDIFVDILIIYLTDLLGIYLYISIFHRNYTNAGRKTPKRAQ